MLKTETQEQPTFVMPEGLDTDTDGQTATYGKFTLQPLERGFGTTIGNSLRRTLLGSLEGAAIQSVHIEGVQHEFSTVEGVVEDVPEIILNLKEVRLRFHGEEQKTIHVTVSTAGELKAGELDVDSDIEIVNKDHKIATLDKGAELSMELTVGPGRGFRLADDVDTEELPIGTIIIDAVYSPITKVNFEVSNSRVGQRTDYDRVDIEVWTDGTTTPRSAVAQAARLLRSHLQLLLEEGEAISEQIGTAKEEEMTSVLDIRVEDLDLSMRSTNCLHAAGIQKVEELVIKSENDMLKYRNFGRKSLIELTEKLDSMGLRFGMPEEEAEAVRHEGVPANLEPNDEKEDDA
jgi:DNA-directed RNA polymerase subunit alpha